MQFEKNQITFIALPFILIFFSIIISSLVKFKPVLSPTEIYNEIEAKKISLILISDGLKMAIIDGTVVNEGDVINDCRIVKIEKDKILLKDQAGEEWIKIE